jgi:hypothetical protein
MPPPSVPAPAAIQSARPPSYATENLPVSSSPELSVSAVESFEPVTRSTPRSNKLGLLERGLLIALGLGCLGVTLHRNDVLGKLAPKSLESALGTPSPNTPQGVRAFTAALPALLPPEALKAKPLPPRAPERTESQVTHSPPPAAVRSDSGKSKKKPAKGKAAAKAK